ncbi:tRNA 5-(aminomethyl)-2-thiouridylate-methyltransferase MnmM [Solidesulfovibrio sp.]
MALGITAALTFSKGLLARALGPGDIVVDATAGGGNDAAFLAGLVAPGGVVHCFDIQAAALAATRARLEQAGLGGLARYHAVGHEHLLEALPAEQHGQVAAVVFNLGFLPGGDPAIITRPRTTLAALTAAQAILRRGGIVSAVCYTGHPGGLDEAERVGDWCASLDFAGWRAARYELVNKQGAAIRLYCMEKRGF